MDIESLQHQIGVYKGLVEVGALINSITVLDDLLPEILDVARRVMQAEASSLFLVDDKGDLCLAVARNSEGGTPAARVTVPRGRGIAGWVLEHRSTLLVPDAYSDPRFYSDVDKKSGYKTRSILCAPLLTGDTEIGVLQVLNPIRKDAFGDSDIDPFNAYANLCAIAIDKLRAMDRLRASELADQQLSLAREIQNSFLPQSLPELPALSFASMYRPAHNVGGDFYDVLQLGEDEIYFVIGDVSGKGVPAALMMAQSLSLFRQTVKPGIPPGEVLSKWNVALFGHTVQGMFITATVGRIIPSSHRVDLATAGHCPPFRVRPSADAQERRVAAGPPLGILDDVRYSSEEVALELDDWLVFFTDGLIESFDSANALLQKAGVQSLLAHRFGSAREVVNALDQGEAAHRQAVEPHDDLTVLVFGFR